MASIYSQARPRAVAADDQLAGPELLSLRPQALWTALRTQHFAFICIAIYLLLEYLKLEQSYPIFAVLPLLRLTGIAAIVGYFADKQTKLVRSPFNWLILLFVLECVVSAFYAYDSDFAFSKLSILTTWAIVFFLISGIVNSERRLFLFLLVYFLANFKMSQFGFFSWASRGFGFTSWGISGAGWFRNSGELGLEMGMFLAYTLCFIAFLRHYWSGWVKWLMYFMPLTALGCIIASSSRGAIIGVVGTLLFLSCFSRRKVRGWAGLALFLWIAYSVMPPQFLARFHSAGDDPTSLSRIAYWAKARELMQEFPYLGIGYYNWIPYYRAHFFDPARYWRVEEAHNTYLQMGAELGYTGLSIFVVMVVTSFCVNARSAKLAKRDGFEFLRAVAIGMNAAGVGLLLASNFLTAFFLPNYWIHFALTVCVSTAVRKKIAALEGTSASSAPKGGEPALARAYGAVSQAAKRA